MTNQKLYPFSMRRDGHNIELAYNHLYTIVKEMYDGSREWDQKVIDSYNELCELYSNAICHPVYWATGKEYGKLKEYSMWSICHRDSMNA